MAELECVEGSGFLVGIFAGGDDGESGCDRGKEIFVRSVIRTVVSDFVNVGVEQRFKIRASEQIADQSAAVVRSFDSSESTIKRELF
jgi:hypothetical protein